jgi:transcriptional regulator with XRE-family HTH domain
MVIGERIRRRRTELHMSLREVAEKAGVTASFLSQIERELADPSIKSLRRIAEALEVPVFYFLSDEQEHRPVVRRHERKKLTLPRSQVTYELLTPDLNRKMEMFIGRIHPSQGNIAHPMSHSTEECLLVLEGRLRVELADSAYELEPGDSIYFDGSQLQSICALGDEEAVFISAITPAVF